MRKALAGLAALLQPAMALADEGGASAWLPGQFASFAAVPGDPGFTIESLFYFRQASATAGVNFSRGGGLLAGLNTTEQYLYLTPGYTFEQPVLHGQLWLGVTFAVGRMNAANWGVLTGPGGGSLSGGSTDSVAGFSDLYPMASLKWQAGPNNFMTYVLASAPTGGYDPNRLAGVGLGHWALDGGLGYTWLGSSGLEFSVTAGLTYNFVNPTTQYRSGVDGHVDLGASYSVNDSLYVGVAGYLYNQLGGDSGGDPRLGEFRSSVMGAGPQAGVSFVVGRVAVDLSLRAYWEFAAYNRPEGWNAFLVLSLARHRGK